MRFVLAQDLPQMGLVPDEGAVQEFASASPDPPFGDRIHAGRPDVAEHRLDPGIGEDRVECGGEVRSGQPRAFRTAELTLFHAASCRFRYSSWASCGVL